MMLVEPEGMVITLRALAFITIIGKEMSSVAVYARFSLVNLKPPESHLLPDFLLLKNLSLVGPAPPARSAPNWQSLGGWSRMERSLHPRKWRLSLHYRGPQSAHC